MDSKRIEGMDSSIDDLVEIHDQDVEIVEEEPQSVVNTLLSNVSIDDTCTDKAQKVEQLSGNNLSLAQQLLAAEEKATIYNELLTGKEIESKAQWKSTTKSRLTGSETKSHDEQDYFFRNRFGEKMEEQKVENEKHASSSGNDRKRLPTLNRMTHRNYQLDYGCHLKDPAEIELHLERFAAKVQGIQFFLHGLPKSDDLPETEVSLNPSTTPGTSQEKSSSHEKSSIKEKLEMNDIDAVNVSGNMGEGKGLEMECLKKQSPSKSVPQNEEAANKRSVTMENAARLDLHPPKRLKPNSMTRISQVASGSKQIPLICISSESSESCESSDEDEWYLYN